MKLKFIKTTLIICTSFFMASNAMAGFDVTRMTTVVDDLSGSYTVTKSGRLENQVFSGTSLTEFNQFHPGQGEHEASISGLISKQTTRGEGEISTTSEGDFTMETLNGSWDVSFAGLMVFASDAGVELSGEVVINDESYDVNELPEGLAIILRRVFWLTRR